MMTLLPAACYLRVGFVRPGIQKRMADLLSLGETLYDENEG